MNKHGEVGNLLRSLVPADVIPDGRVTSKIARLVRHDAILIRFVLDTVRDLVEEHENTHGKHVVCDRCAALEELVRDVRR